MKSKQNAQQFVEPFYILSFRYLFVFLYEFDINSTKNIFYYPVEGSLKMLSNQTPFYGEKFENIFWKWEGALST